MNNDDGAAAAAAAACASSSAAAASACLASLGLVFSHTQFHSRSLCCFTASDDDFRVFVIFSWCVPEALLYHRSSTKLTV